MNAVGPPRYVEVPPGGFTDLSHPLTLMTAAEVAEHYATVSGCTRDRLHLYLGMGAMWRHETRWISTGPFELLSRALSHRKIQKGQDNDRHYRVPGMPGIHDPALRPVAELSKARAPVSCAGRGFGRRREARLMPEDHLIRVLPADTPGLVRTAEYDVDDRWLRAFAASVGDTRPELFDLDRSGGVLAHPVFPVCIEWPLVEFGAPGIELTVDTLRLGLHVSHRTRLHAPLQPGQRVRTEAELYLAEARSNAVHIATEFRTFSSDGKPIVTTHLHMLYRGVRLEGTKTPPSGPWDPSPSTEAELIRIATFDVDATNAVVYSECAKIWNPIHTDIRIARAAGLPNTVLHGTEVLARAVSAVTRADVFPLGMTITGIDCRFTSPVFPGMTLAVNAGRVSGNSIAFDVQGADGTSPISGGLITFESAASIHRAGASWEPSRDRAESQSSLSS